MGEKPSAEELLRKIQELEARHAHIKQQISKIKPQRSNSNSPCTHHLPRAIGAMQLTETQYLNIMHSMGQAMHIFDHKYRIYFWNRTAEVIYGLTAAEVFGKTPTEILVDPKDAVLADYLLERTVNGERWSGQFPVTNKRGETFVVVCTNTPLRDANEKIIGGICVSSDSRPYRSMRPKSEPIKRIQPSIATKIVNLTKGNLDDSIQSGWGHIPFGVFSSGKIAIAKTEIKHEEWAGKQWPYNESLAAKLSYFGWQRLYANQEDHGNKMEASGLLLSTLPVSKSSSSDSIIKVQPDYEIMWEDLITKQQIGQGSCGTVYHGQWYGSDVAIKVFTYQEYSNDVMTSFKQEVSLMKRLRHPNVLLFMGAVTSPKHLCIVTEFLPRGSLFHTLQRNSRQLDLRRRLQIAIDIARGMNYLHHCNPPIVHRDLKSSNLLVDKNWTVKVGDFGLSRIKYQTYLKTKSGKGTPQWMAPEIFHNEQADEKSDVYSYGVVLWEIITSKIPWDDLNPMQVVAAVGFMNRRLDIPKDVDPLWSSLIQSCWCSDPQSRPSFQEILYKLKDMQKKFAVQRRR